MRYDISRQLRTAVFPIVHKETAEMENEKKTLIQEEKDPKPLTDEEFKEYQEKDARTTKKVLRFFKAIWEAINFFGT